MNGRITDRTLLLAGLAALAILPVSKALLIAAGLFLLRSRKTWQPEPDRTA
ncbi:MAG: hypothetical protein ACE5E1_07030 [Phycisphaerae bacterium]